MPKLNAPQSANGTSQVATLRSPEAQRDISTFYQCADALYRCALESCRQHERLSRLVGDGAMSAEQRAVRSLATVCDDALADMVKKYEEAATRAAAERDTACWQAANSLWLSSRELLRRLRTSARAARDLGDGKHSTDRLAELAIDYDLEASALLQLRQAADGYHRVRPHAAA